MMKIFIASEFRCHIYKGEYYLSRRAFTIYKRYSEAFGRIVLCSRYISIAKLEPDLYKADFIEDTISIDSLLFTLIGNNDTVIREKIGECSLVICRMPSIIAYRSADIAKKMGKQVLAEIMCDGWDPYWNHGLSGKLIARYMHNKMKEITYNANYAVYVTENYLQSRYPCKNKSINASNVELKSIDNQVLATRLEKIAKRSIGDKEITLMTTATVDLLSKGHRFVVRSMGKLKKQGIRVVYYLVGDGKHDILNKEARKAGVEDQLVFLGVLTLDEVFRQIDKVDIYIQPSLQEGLPRAVIEAMSRACPCLGAKTAGIPELLANECIFERSSTDSVTDAILHMVQNDMSKYAKENFEHSKEYLEDVLDKRRSDYFREIYSNLKGL